MKKQLWVFLAPSGCGKSTACKYLIESYGGENIKLASPLYEIQKFIYQKMNMDISSQDGELLQFLGHKIQKIKPDYLFNEFLIKFNQSHKSFIINDDCRPHNYGYLKKMGAIFIKISGPVRSRSQDISHHQTNHPVEWQEPIPFDYEIFNHKDENFLYAQLDELVRLLCG